MSSITLKNIHKEYGKEIIIPELNFTIEDGSFTVLVGPSGCGKSTTLRMIAGLEKPSSGEILIDDENVVDVEPGKRGIAMVFQNYALYPTMSVKDNIEFGLKNKKIPKEERKQLIEDVSEIVGLTPYLNRKPSELSGGQRQRVAIARALASDPKILLFELVTVTEPPVRGGVSVGQALLDVAFGYGVVDPFEVDLEVPDVFDSEARHRDREFHFAAFDPVADLLLRFPVPIAAAYGQRGGRFVGHLAVDHILEMFPIRLVASDYVDKQSHPVLVLVRRDIRRGFYVKVEVSAVISDFRLDDVVAAGIVGVVLVIPSAVVAVHGVAFVRCEVGSHAVPSVGFADFDRLGRRSLFGRSHPLEFSDVVDQL